MIEIRRAKMKDKARIVEISSKIWDGEDYLPHIFEKWVNEEGGEFTVITVDDVVAGCAKMTLLPHGVLWLEGIRVDTDYRGQGLGKKMADYQLKRAGEMGYKRLELGTFVENYESLAIIKKRGFEKVASFKFLFNAFEEAPEFTKNSVSTDVKAVKSFEEVKEVLQLLDSHHRNTYINLDWTFIQCDKELLTEFINRGLVYRMGDTVFAYGDWNQKDGGMSLYFMFGNQKDEVIKYVLTQAKEKKASNVMIMSSGGKEEHALLLENGFISLTDEEEDAFVYRYKENK